MEIKEDLAIAAIRAVRHEISAEFEHDLSKLFEHYVELQKQYEERLLNTDAEHSRSHMVAQSGLI